MSLFVAKVKNVLSGDTVVLVPSKTAQFPAPERILTLSYVRAADSFEAKEYLRNLLIGKEIKFKVNYKNPQTNREFGDIQSPIFKSLIQYLLEKGLVKLKDNFSEQDGDIYYDLHEVENAAKLNNLGVWNTSAASDNVEIVALTENIIKKSQKYPLKVIVEKVISGDRVMARLVVNKNQHVTTPLLLAGIRAPRTDDANQPAATTKVAQQGKAFVEEKLLTTKAELTASIIGESQTGVPIATINHPSGNNIHEKFLEQGFGEVVDWQSTLVGSTAMMGLRRAEQTAKALGKGLYANPTARPSTAGSAGLSSKNLKPGSTIENAQIAKVIGADTLVIRLPHSDEELTVQLASIRAPRPNDTTVTTDHSKQLALVATAREFVRHQVIGKNGTVFIDGYRNENKEMGFDARFLVSFKYNGNVDLSETIVENGWGTVIKHNKATSHERSLNWDKLIEIEEEQKKAGKKGLFFTGDISKVLTVGTRIIDASENLAKAKTFFNGFKQKGRISGGYHVEFIPSANRVKLYNPREGLKLTLILGGLSNDKASALGEEGLKFMNKKFLQRPVEFEIYDQDKIGSFIGNLFSTTNTLVPVQVSLLEQGLIKVHELAINSNPFAADLIKAEESAKASKKGIWSTYDEAKVQAELAQNTAALNQLNLENLKPKFFDIEVVDVDSTGVLTFHHLDATTVSKFSEFKKRFNDFHLKIPSASTASVDLPHNLTKAPKKNELVSARFSENNKYYRAKVLNFDKATNKYEVKHLDFGNVDKVALNALRVLPTQFNLQAYPSFAHTTTLQNIVLPPSKPTDYLTDALYALEDLTFDKKLVISALPSSDPSVEYEGILYDSEESLKDSTYTINKQLVSEGWGIVDTKLVKPPVKDYVSELLTVQKKAKSSHSGCWEFGDVSFDEDGAF
ncbi:staphylococcal nuclease domain-containing protein 1 [Scheffersomyces xylosifermentans]|uniref:staphylococcal nuclease domain-containing protein 1 n=1 Tax=Scheffersomyces xylosifermentans TaxID=1304137 RepID=UPI00315C99A5